MSKQRWQPPSMNKPTAGESSEPAKMKVDEQVVRKMLKVNPALRAGRTTAQVKKSLERGEPLVQREAAAAPTPSHAADTASQLRDTIRFFLSGKADAFAAKRQDIDAKRKALDEELAAARAGLREQVVGFVKLLDRGTVDANEGAMATAFAEQSALLRELGLDAKSIAEAVRKSR
ncbi:MAG: hypothetical protein ACAI38_25005 [Myxococcota bacterium]|nr:hypothetical protein [Myxococcota bacterium]